MRHFVTLLCVVAALGLAAVPVAEAQTRGMTLGAFGGIGGSPDSDGYDGSGFQLLAAMELSPRSLTGVRFGELAVTFDSPFVLGETLEHDLTYLTVGTEYRWNADYYVSGLLIGLGYYRLESDALPDDEDSLGLNLGVTGDFRINSRWSVVVELGGHYANFDAAQFFLMAHAGFVFRL